MRLFSSGTTTSAPNTCSLALCKRGKALPLGLSLFSVRTTPKVRQQVMQLLSGYLGPASQRTSMSRSVVRRRLSDPPHDTFAERVGREWTAVLCELAERLPDYEAAYEELGGDARGRRHRG